MKYDGSVIFAWTALGSDPQPDARRWLHAFLCEGTMCNDGAYYRMKILGSVSCAWGVVLTLMMHVAMPGFCPCSLVSPSSPSLPYHPLQLATVDLTQQVSRDSQTYVWPQA
jgi:hypothetical protein